MTSVEWILKNLEHPIHHDKMMDKIKFEFDLESNYLIFLAVPAQNAKGVIALKSGNHEYIWQPNSYQYNTIF